MAASSTLVEDAQALLNGDADHLLSNEQLVDTLYNVDPRDHIDRNPRATDTNVTPLVHGTHVTPYVSLAQLQLQPQVPAAPIVPSINSQGQHANANASRQCPYGCTNTFGRPGEYRRHMKKHNGPFYPCTRAHCSKMFYRQDKLRDHLDKGH